MRIPAFETKQSLHAYFRKALAKRDIAYACVDNCIFEATFDGEVYRIDVHVYNDDSFNESPDLMEAITTAWEDNNCEV